MQYQKEYEAYLRAQQEEEMRKSQQASSDKPQPSEQKDLQSPQKDVSGKPSSPEQKPFDDNTSIKLGPSTNTSSNNKPPFPEQNDSGSDASGE